MNEALKQGHLFWTAVDNAWGTPVEFQSGESIAINLLTEMGRYGTYSFPSRHLG